GSSVPTNVHDFLDKELGTAIPYGVYDVSTNTGWVSVGTDHDTSAFAVATLRRWWDTIGRRRYPHADRLLICADGGGSTGSRVRAWKVELAALAAETGLAITVCHLPPGTSKWNKIEHRLFSQITMNWRGRPLKSHRMIVDLIGNTTTTTGLTVHCVLDTDQYPTGITYTAKDVDTLPITRHEFHTEWNYTVEPTRPYTTKIILSRVLSLDGLLFAKHLSFVQSLCHPVLSIYRPGTAMLRNAPANSTSTHHQHEKPARQQQPHITVPNHTVK
ncbi:MAG TPA: ISAzo13 family transposase, partial [Mycobacterium sp.]|nr:ISAzo13 family transposase [Mycobacterium sp.]